MVAFKIEENDLWHLTLGYRLWDVAQFISLYRKEGNLREQPLKNKWEYTEH